MISFQGKKYVTPHPGVGVRTVPKKFIIIWMTSHTVCNDFELLFEISFQTVAFKNVYKEEEIKITHLDKILTPRIPTKWMTDQGS